MGLASAQGEGSHRLCDLGVSTGERTGTQKLSEQPSPNDRLLT